MGYQRRVHGDSSLESQVELTEELKMARSIDWTRLGWCMTQNVKVGSHSTSAFAAGKVRYAQFKAVSDQVMGAHSAASARPKSIDFAAYKAALPQGAWVE